MPGGHEGSGVDERAALVQNYFVSAGRDSGHPQGSECPRHRFPLIPAGTILSAPAGEPPFAHTSIIAPLRARFGIAALGARDAQAPDARAILAPQQPRADDSLDGITPPTAPNPTLQASSPRSAPPPAHSSPPRREPQQSCPYQRPRSRSPRRCGLHAPVVAIPGLRATGRPTGRGAGRSRALMNPARLETVHWGLTPAAVSRPGTPAGGSRRNCRLNAADAESVLLVTHELVTNAVEHARTPFELTVSFDKTAVLVEVFDESTLLPDLQPLNLRAARGRGLQMVAALAGPSSCPTPKPRTTRSLTTRRRSLSRYSRIRVGRHAERYCFRSSVGRTTPRSPHFARTYQGERK
jgi:hypothetical protein